MCCTCLLLPIIRISDKDNNTLSYLKKHTNNSKKPLVSASTNPTQTHHHQQEHHPQHSWAGLSSMSLGLELHRRTSPGVKWRRP